MKSNNSFPLLVIILMLTGISFNPVNGQQAQPHILCGTDIMTQKLLAAHPELIEKYNQYEAYTQSYVKNLKAQRKAAKTKTGHNISANVPTKYIIPIVFHILHQDGPENISDAQIMSEMKILNEDWGHTNPDTGYAVTSYFKSIEGNNQVEFRLAQIDPNGNCTNGIDRIYTNRTNQADDLSKLNTWNPTKYVNVWVCASISSGAISGGTTLGYAYFPWEIGEYGLQQYDGVLICHFCIGTIGTALTNGGLGGTPGEFYRCLSHEIGHVMNLEHPWGLTNSPGVIGKYQYSNPKTPCGDDGVDDTPNTEGYFSFCPTGGGNSVLPNINLADTIYGEICDTTSIDTISTNPLQLKYNITLENFQNFMDYSECSMMFTQGQTDRVQAALNTYAAGRSNLWSPANLLATGVVKDTITYAYDTATCVPVANFYGNECFVCKGATVDFYDNTTVGTPTNWLWTFTGASVPTSTVENPVVTFDSLYGQTVSLTASNNAGSSSITKYQYVYVSPLWTTYFGAFSEGFENLTEVANTWLFDDVYNNGTSWKVTNTAAATGGYSLMLNSFAPIVYTTNTEPPEIASLGNGPLATWDAITPSVNMTTASNMTFSFDYSCATMADLPAAITETLELDYSLDCGASWIKIKSITGSALANAGNCVTAYTPTLPTQWQNISIPLSAAVVGRPNVRFRLRYTSGVYSNNIYIDNVNLSGTVGIENVSEDTYNMVVYPNPMSNAATISYYLPSDQPVHIAVYDITGREIEELSKGSEVAGQHTLYLNNDNLANGMYFIKLVSGNSKAVNKKLIVIK